jgi:IS30 family transposase
MSKVLSAAFYFSQPYSSWERGLNENIHGLLRQYFPKNTIMKMVNQSQVIAAVERLNNRPRKPLGYKTPEQLMNNDRVAMTELQ